MSNNWYKRATIALMAAMVLTAWAGPNSKAWRKVESREALIPFIEKLWDESATELKLAEVVLRTVDEGLYVPENMVIKTDQDILDLV